MDAVAPAAHQAADLIQKLSLEPKAKGNDALESARKAGPVNSGGVPNRLITSLHQDYMDADVCYRPNGYPSSTTHYCGGVDGSISKWEDYNGYLSTDGLEMPSPGVYEDIYHHGHDYGSYDPYPSPGSPVPTLGHDGQLYGPRHYQFPASYYQQAAPSIGKHNVNKTPSSKDVTTSAAHDRASIFTGTTKSNSYGAAKENIINNNGLEKPNSSLQNQSLNSNCSPGGLLASVYEDRGFGIDDFWSPRFDGAALPDGQQRPTITTAISSTASLTNNTSSRNQNHSLFSHFMSMSNQRSNSAMGLATPGANNRLYTNNRIYGKNANLFSNGFGSNFYDSGSHGPWGALADNTYRNRDHYDGLYVGNEKLNGLTKLNRGPRTDMFRSEKGLRQTSTLSVKGQRIPTVVNVRSSTALDKDQFNRADFPDTYSDAKFFVIKSYSEDNVHRSVKYNVWASTPKGNIKLDAAYQEAQEKTSGCPVFLFFSVNTSGQFVGVAEMVGPVDFNKTVNYWQQDKWTGCFPINWHIVKDVPNSALKHITLENNDNKPITNSRDTQEVMLDQGLQVLKIFKEYGSNTSILDDFFFYESRQTIMLDKREKQQLQKTLMDLKYETADAKDKDGINGKFRLEAPREVVPVLKEHGKIGVAANTLWLREKLVADKHFANGIGSGI